MRIAQIDTADFNAFTKFTTCLFLRNMLPEPDANENKIDEDHEPRQQTKHSRSTHHSVSSTHHSIFI